MCFESTDAAGEACPQAHMHCDSTGMGIITPYLNLFVEWSGLGICNARRRKVLALNGFGQIGDILLVVWQQCPVKKVHNTHMHVSDTMH